MNENSLLYWYPKIKGLVPTPETEWVEFPDWRILCAVIDGDPEKKFDLYIPQVLAAARKIGYPLFMRTDQSSAKHDWIDTCFVPDEAHVLGNLGRLLDMNFCCDLDPVALVFRRFIEMDYKFRAFRGMPVAKEVRMFVRDGEIQCSHFYWPEEAIEFYGDTKPPKKWRSLLRATARISKNDKLVLRDYAGRIARALPGYWSVDFCHGKNGEWWFIDAARGEQSYHDPKCRFKTAEVHERKKALSAIVEKRG